MFWSLVPLCFTVAGWATLYSRYPGNSMTESSVWSERGYCQLTFIFSPVCYRIGPRTGELNWSWACWRGSDSRLFCGSSSIVGLALPVVSKVGWSSWWRGDTMSRDHRPFGSQTWARRIKRSVSTSKALQWLSQGCRGWDQLQIRVTGVNDCLRKFSLLPITTYSLVIYVSCNTSWVLQVALI